MKLSDIAIDEVFANALPDTEKWQEVKLFTLIEEHGVQDSLKVWAEKKVLLDGHRRLKIWDDNKQLAKLHDPPNIQLMSFGSEVEALAWVKSNQYARRNESGVAKAVNEGLKVESQQGRRNDLSGQSDKFTGAQREKRRADKQAAEGWKAVAAVAPDVAQKILGDPQTPVTAKDLRQVAKASPEEKPELAKAVADKASGKASRKSPVAPESVAGKVLARLQQGPASPEELADIDGRYCSRISELRSEHGFNIVQGDDKQWSLIDGKPKKKAEATDQIVAKFSKLPATTKHAVYRKLSADEDVASLREKKMKAASLGDGCETVGEHIVKKLYEVQHILKEVQTRSAGKAKSWMNHVTNETMQDCIRVLKCINSAADNLSDTFSKGVKDVHD